MYQLAKKILFKMNPEFVHAKATQTGNLLGKSNIARNALAKVFNYESEMLRQEVNGIKFKNPVGLGAGFDYNGKLVDILPSFGFGFEEVGSATALPCKGNPSPTLHRLPKDRSIIVYKGLRNDGIDIISKRIDNGKHLFPIGLSIARTNCETVTDEKALDDWMHSYKTAMNSTANYIAINLSCPNSFSGLKYTDPNLLKQLMKKLNEIKKTKPVYAKISPDLEDNNLKEIIEICLENKANGFITTNLSKTRDNLTTEKEELKKFKGGHSGRPIAAKSLATLKKVKKLVPEETTLISLGGIFTAKDAFQRFENGAHLIQIVTALIYEGPSVVSIINKGLVEIMKENGLESLSELTGRESSGEFTSTQTSNRP